MMVAPTGVQAIREALAVLVEPGNVVELRVPQAGRAGTVSGYFNDLDAAAKAAGAWSGKAPGVYFTVNPVNSVLLARSSNRVQERAKHTTSDADIKRRRWLYVDADAVRPAGICSTDVEHGAALERVGQIRDFLVDQGVSPASIVTADSGNGGSLYVRVDLPNDPDALALVKAVLEALHSLFSDRAVSVDRSVGNEARVARVPGTLNAKGDSTPDRPHRVARLLDVPDTLAACPRDILERIAALAPEPERTGRAQGQSYAGPSFDLDAWLAASGLEVSREKPWGTGTVYELVECPWNSEHKRTARIVRFDNGALSAGCFHDSCQGKGWRDLRDAVGVTPSWTPPPSSNGQPAEGGGDVRLRRMADVASESVEWLWHPYIPIGKVTLLEGDPGVGKSWVALALATAVSLGKGLPGVEVKEGKPESVLIASAEDGLGDTIRPRLDAMGADVSRIHALDGPLTLDDAGLLALESTIATVRPQLLVLDPLVAYLSGELDIHRANEVRHVMAKLARLAETYSLAVLVVRHLAKGGASKPIYRGLGSIDFTAACRSVLLAGHAADNSQARGLVHIKSNLAPIGPAIGYELRDGRFYWTGESLLTAADILAPDDGAGASALEEAVNFLQEQLTAGPVLATQVWGDADDAGLKHRTVNRAKAKMGVVTHRQGSAGKRGGGGFMWHLPGDLHCQDCHKEKVGNVNHSKAETRADVLTLGNQNGVEV